MLSRSLLHCAGYVKALEDALKVIDSIAFPIDTNNRARPALSCRLQALNAEFLPSCNAQARRC